MQDLSPEASAFAKRPPMKETAADRAVKSGALQVTGDVLRQIIEQFETLAQEKSSIGDAQKAVMAEAKAQGFDTKAIRRIIALRKLDPARRQEEDAILETYLAALGMD